MNYGRKKAGYFIMVVAFVLVVVAAVTAVFMLLWNWLVPMLFTGPALTYWQALGLLVMAKIIFGLASHGKHWKKDHHWKHRWRERCADMTPEDKERMKHQFMHRWCSHPTEETAQEESSEK